MCETNEKENNKIRKGNNPWHITYGFFRNLFLHGFMLCRIFLESFIDYLFSFFWEDKVAIPPLQKSHHILQESAVKLASKIRTGELKSETLVRACIERMLQVNPIINAITDERFEEALKEAREIDEKIHNGLPQKYFEERPFLGVPFTTKDSIAVEGMRHTLGLVSRRNTRAVIDADCVTRLRDAGAIPLALTNVPECNQWQETRNMLFGQTNNPYHTGRTVGGSSGGEAALNACMATPISLCSDIGGSTRMPAFYCGLFGLNPSAGSTNLRGIMHRTGLGPTIASVGFLSRHVTDLGPLTLVVAPAAYLNTTFNIANVRYYYVPVVRTWWRASPVRYELRQLMDTVVSQLTKLGPLTPRTPQLYYHPSFEYMYSLWRHAMTKEKESFPLLLGNNRNKPYGLWELAKKMVGASQFTLAAIMKLIDEQVLPRVNPEWAERTTKNLQEDLTRLLDKDTVLLFPSAPQSAPYHYGLLLRPYNFSYWALFNTLCFPALQVPLGLDKQGLPIGIQVVAGPKQEALCLAVGIHLQQIFTTYVPPHAIQH